MAFGEHSSKQYDLELESVRERVLMMGELVEEQVRRSIDALIKGDTRLMDAVISDDHRVNALEVAVGGRQSSGEYQ